MQGYTHLYSLVSPYTVQSNPILGLFWHLKFLVYLQIYTVFHHWKGKREDRTNSITTSSTQKMDLLQHSVSNFFNKRQFPSGNFSRVGNARAEGNRRRPFKNPLVLECWILCFLAKSYNIHNDSPWAGSLWSIGDLKARIHPRIAPGCIVFISVIQPKL